jgi:carbon monoxide dehydrogenase subunit G
VDLQNGFVVPTSPAEAWQALLDVERIAPCLPGATLDGEVEPGTYQGRVKVKVGPIVTTYRGTITFEEIDEANRKVVLLAKGKEMRGAGTADAHVVATLSDAGSQGTRVDVTTELGLTGKPAQFGRAVLGEVSSKLVQQFADNLAAQLQGGPEAEAATPGAGRSAPAAEPEPLDLVQLAGGSVAKRAVPAVAAVVAIAVVAFVVLRRRKS